MRLRDLYALGLSGCLVASLACTSSREQAATPVPGTGSSPTAEAAAASPTGTPAARATNTTVARPTVVRTARTQGVGNVMQVALLRGYFQEEGLDVQQIEFGTAADALPALSTGELDAGSSAALPSLFNALGRDIHLTLALDATHLGPGTGGYPLIARLANGTPVVREIADLRGKRFAEPSPGSPQEPLAERMLADAGLGLGDLGDIQYLSFPNTLAAFAAGTMDATMAPEPWGAIAEDRGVGVRVADSSPYVPGLPVAMIVFSERFARDRPEAARQFAIAYLRAARAYMDAMESGHDREAILALLAKATNVEPRILEQAGYLPINRNGRIDVAALRNLLDWLAEHGYVPQKPDLDTVVDHRFADAAASALDNRR